MGRVNLLNSAALLGAIAVSTVLTGSLGVRDAGSAATPRETKSEEFVEDADGVAIPARPYTRIVSASTISDQVLVELVEPSRILAVTKYTLEHGGKPWRYEGMTGIANARDLEAILQLEPDIVFVNAFADVRHLERMKETGLTVFNLGDLRGVETLLANIDHISNVVGETDRGAALSEDFIRRFEHVAARVPESDRRRGLYAAIYAGKLYGGAKGSSIHDVLTAAGLIDVAAEAGYRGSPAYTSEQLLQLDPPWIVTSEEGEARLCDFPGLGSLTACGEGQVRGVSDALMGDPGLGMLRAAEAVHAAVYQ